MNGAREVTVVIGAGGMGEAIARRVGSGTRILLADLDPDLLDRVAGELLGDGFDVATRIVDVRSEDAIADLAAVADDAGPVTRVAHTAGLSGVQAPAQTVLAVDLLGVAYTLEHFGRVIAPRGAGVVIASMAAHLLAGSLSAEQEHDLASTDAAALADLPFLRAVLDGDGDSGLAYAIAKRANQLRVQAASPVWGARGARVNSLSPGVIATPMGLAELGGPHGARMREQIDGSASGRMGTVSEVAAGAAFLLGPDASFITGTDLLVDGGATAGSLRAAAVSGAGTTVGRR